MGLGVDLGVDISKKSDPKIQLSVGLKSGVVSCVNIKSYVGL